LGQPSKPRTPRRRPMELVLCHKKYWDFIYTLRHQLKDGFIDQDDFSPKDHIRFMKKNHKEYMVCLDEEKPIGFIGSINGDIRVAVSHASQKKGVGKFMVKSLLTKNSNVYAKVKIENEASLRLFSSCGFTKKYYILEP